MRRREFWLRDGPGGRKSQWQEVKVLGRAGAVVRAGSSRQVRFSDRKMSHARFPRLS